jgi:hypothetical protein
MRAFGKRALTAAREPAGGRKQVGKHAIKSAISRGKNCHFIVANAGPRT